MAYPTKRLLNAELNPLLKALITYVRSNVDISVDYGLSVTVGMGEMLESGSVPKTDDSRPLTRQPYPCLPQPIIVNWNSINKLHIIDLRHE